MEEEEGADEKGEKVMVVEERGVEDEDEEQEEDAKETSRPSRRNGGIPHKLHTLWTFTSPTPHSTRGSGEVGSRGHRRSKRLLNHDENMLLQDAT